MKKFNPDSHFDNFQAIRIQPPQKIGARILDVGPHIELVPSPLLTYPLQRSEYERYLGQQVLVTFQLDVPLEIIVGGDMAVFVSDVAFEDPVALSEMHYRAVGAAYDDFDSKYCGRVYLQIMCVIDTPSEIQN